MKKRILSVILIAATALSITGCGIIEIVPMETAPATAITVMTTTEPEETAPTATSTVATTTTVPTAPTAVTEPIEAFNVTNELSDIKKVCGLKSDVETSIESCAVDVFDEKNPYDVVYDYGEDYSAYVRACDWSLVFDSAFYIEEFPLLATLYQNDIALLRKHFQTVGIHEGRQASPNFNVRAYMDNCDPAIREAFGDNYEGYYLYYMLNYETEQYVTTTGPDYEIQYKHIMTKCQAEELDGVNMYRAEVGTADIAFNSELAAFANYRAWINAHNDQRSHDWAKASCNRPFLNTIMYDYGANSISENTCYYNNYLKTYGYTNFTSYRNSHDHYEAMINAKHDLIGLSNIYYSREDNFTNHFQAFLDLKPKGEF